MLLSRFRRGPRVRRRSVARAVVVVCGSLHRGHRLIEGDVARPDDASRSIGALPVDSSMDPDPVWSFQGEEGVPAALILPEPVCASSAPCTPFKSMLPEPVCAFASPWPEPSIAMLPEPVWALKPPSIPVAMMLPEPVVNLASWPTPVSVMLPEPVAALSAVSAGASIS